jgi:hypothetical protein
MSEGKPSIGEFLLAFSRSWLPLLCGVLSIPFAAVAAFAESIPSRLIWTTVAIIAFLTSSYLIWKKERTTVIDLRERLRPKLRLSFDMNDPGCKESGSSDAMKWDWYRIRVEADGATSIKDCRGRLISVKTSSRSIVSGENPNFSFAFGGSVEKTIHPGVPEFLYFLLINDENFAGLMLRPPFSTSFDWNSIFQFQDDYMIDIAVVSTDAPSALISIHFKRTNNRESACLWQDSIGTYTA